LAVVVLQESPEALAALHLAGRELQDARFRLIVLAEWHIALGLVRPYFVTVLHELPHDVGQVGLPQIRKWSRHSVLTACTNLSA
jgi:hypothetical protein